MAAVMTNFHDIVNYDYFMKLKKMQSGGWNLYPAQHLQNEMNENEMPSRG